MKIKLFGVIIAIPLSFTAFAQDTIVTCEVYENSNMIRESSAQMNRGFVPNLGEFQDGINAYVSFGPNGLKIAVRGELNSFETEVDARKGSSVKFSSSKNDYEISCVSRNY